MEKCLIFEDNLSFTVDSFYKEFINHPLCLGNEREEGTVGSLSYLYTPSCADMRLFEIFKGEKE